MDIQTPPCGSAEKWLADLLAEVHDENDAGGASESRAASSGSADALEEWNTGRWRRSQVFSTGEGMLFIPLPPEEGGEVTIRSKWIF